MGKSLKYLASLFPGKVVLTQDGGGDGSQDRTVTYEELDSASNRLARAYQSMGVAQGSFVVVGLKNGIEFWEAVFAVWKLGATPCPVSYRIPEVERQQIIELAEPALVVGTERAGDAQGCPYVPPGFIPDPSISDAELPDAVAKHEVAIPSGGSTGRSKLIVSMNPSRCPVAGRFTPYKIFYPSLTDVIRQRFVMPYGATDLNPPGHQVARLGYAGGVHMVTGPLYHFGPFTQCKDAIFAGMQVVIMPSFNEERWLQLVERHRVTFSYLVPTMMHRIMRLPEEVRKAADVSSIDAIHHMAAPIAPWLKKLWCEWLGPEKVWELYSSSESVAFCAVRGDEWLKKLETGPTVGRVLSGEMTIVGEDGKRAPPGTFGEVYMRQAAKRGAETFRYRGGTPTRLDLGDGPPWTSVGDMGMIDREGFVFLGDRKKDMVLIGGSNVFPAEVEAALEEHAAVHSCAVVGRPDDEMGNVLHAVLHCTAQTSESELKTWLSTRLTPYKIPRTFNFVGEPVRDDAGKTRRSAL